MFVLFVLCLPHTARQIHLLMRNKKSHDGADRVQCVLACKLHSLCRYYLSRFAKSLFGALCLLELPDIIGNTATDKEKSSHFVCHASSDQFRQRNFRLALLTLLNFPCAFCNKRVF